MQLGYLSDLNNSGSAYQTIFGGTNYETGVVCKSTLPQSAVFGYSYKPNGKWVVNADVEWMDWSSTEEEKLAYPNETDATRLSVLNSGNPAPRDWNSAWSAALGAQYSLSDRLRLRGGYYYHQTPIPADTFETPLPDADSHSLAAGFGYDFTKSLTLDFTYSRMFYLNRVIDNSVALGTINGTYRQQTDLYLATLTYKF